MYHVLSGPYVSLHHTQVRTYKYEGTYIRTFHLHLTHAHNYQDLDRKSRRCRFRCLLRHVVMPFLFRCVLRLRPPRPYYNICVYSYFAGQVLCQLNTPIHVHTDARVVVKNGGTRILLLSTAAATSIATASKGERPFYRQLGFFPRARNYTTRTIPPFCDYLVFSNSYSFISIIRRFVRSLVSSTFATNQYHTTFRSLFVAVLFTYVPFRLLARIDVRFLAGLPILKNVQICTIIR